MQSTDILIVGGGLTGLSLANALADSKYSIMLVEGKEFIFNQDFNYDSRPIALTRGSVCLLEQWGVWADLEPFCMPIQQVHVSEKGGFGFTRIDAQSMKVPALGYVVEMPALMSVLYAKARTAKNVTFCSPTQLNHCEQDPNGWLVHLLTKDKVTEVHTSLLVAADGEKSKLRETLGLSAKTHDYHQAAIVSNIGVMREHHGIAYERFTQTGAIALLPMKENRCGLVWTDQRDAIAQLSELSDEDFLNALQTKFGFRLGRFTKVGRRQCHPLQSVIAPEQVAHHAILLGNSAHTQHPLAAQGFNLGIRDIHKLASLLGSGSDATTIAMSDILLAYSKSCQTDQFRTIQFTHYLAKIFGSRVPGVFSLRNLAMLGIDLFPASKQQFARMAMGLWD